MKRLAIYLCTFNLLLFSGSSHACSCIKRESKDYLANCDLFFTAILTESKLEKIDGPTKVEIGKFDHISQIIKGQPDAEYSIENTRSGTSCDSNLLVGEEYIVCVNTGQKLRLQACGFTHSLYYGGSEAFIESLNN